MIKNIKKCGKCLKTNKKVFNLFVFSLVILILCSSVTVIAVSQNEVEVFCGEKEETVKVYSLDEEKIAEKAGFDVCPMDTLTLDESGETKTLTIKKANDVLIKVDNKPKKIVRICGTVGDALKKANVKINKFDSVSCKLTDSVTAPMTVKIKRAVTITLTDNGKKSVFHSTKDTVGEFLKENKLVLDHLDKINVKPSSKLKNNMKIVINRVKKSQRAETCESQFEVKNEGTDSLFEGESRVAQQGKNGTEKLVFVDKFIDGKKVETELKEKITLIASIPEIILHGTKKKFRANTRSQISKITAPDSLYVDESGKPIHAKKVMTGNATAYTGGGTTSSGKPAMCGRVAVDPSVIPYGTKLYIMSTDGKYVYGYCEAADTGSFINRGDTLCDLYFDTKSECRSFGRREVALYIV